jgi:hypothetical protein
VSRDVIYTVWSPARKHLQSSVKNPKFMVHYLCTSEAHTSPEPGAVSSSVIVYSTICASLNICETSGKLFFSSKGRKSELNHDENNEPVLTERAHE